MCSRSNPEVKHPGKRSRLLEWVLTSMTCVLIRGRQGDLRLSSLGAQIVKYLPAMQETEV